MALTFPSSPSNGQIYADTTTGNRYIYNATAGVWSFAANNVGMSVSSTPPSNVAPGAMWFNREIGRTFVYYDDGDSKQWIETVPAGAVDTNVVAGYVNPVFASMNGAYTTANASFGVANSAYASINSNWTVTNTVYGVANSGFAKANNALANTSGVSFAGDLYVPSGSVGIGINSPANKLHVYSGSSGAVSYDSRYKSIIENSGECYLALYSPTFSGIRFANNTSAVLGYMDYYVGSDKLVLSAGTGGVSIKSNNYERLGIDASGRVTLPYQPAFSASLSATWSAGSGVSTIPFASSNFNVGSCYNTSTYRFTAPIAGKYLFMCNLGSNSTTSTFTYFGVLVYVNGSQILAGWQSKALTSGSYICDSKTLMINLSLNDYVEFKLEISSAQGIATGVVCGQLIS